jgi:diphthamide biosynthesis protein 7
MEPYFINKRFEGGVTTITSHPLIENLIAVGSYDSIVRLIDKRTPLKQPVLSSFNCGGGIWRLKWHPTNPKRLLVAAMHNGFSVIDFPGLETTTTTNGESSSERIIVPGEGILVKRFEKHQSLAYGVDWNQGAGEEQTLDGKDLIASCSFYDHALHIWSV